MTTPVLLWEPDGKRIQQIALSLGCAGLVLCAVGASFDLKQFFHSYLMAFTSLAGLALGSLALWMIHNLTGGVWGLVLRRFLEAATRTFPFLALAFLPVAFALSHIYKWAELDVSQNDAQAQYLNVPFFLARTSGYFAAWLILSFFLNRWSAQQDRSDDPRPGQRMQALSGPGLAIFGLTVTFAAIDWIMSLDPTWSSTIFGALVATGQLLPALGLAIALATWFSVASGEGRVARKSQELLATRHSPLATVSLDAWNDLGSLLLTFVMLWSYMMFSQLLLIWSGNLPEEISYYLKRSAGGWQWIGVLLALFYFALPFVLLLSRKMKREPGRLRIVALIVVGMSFVHQFWMIAPVFSPGQFQVHWLDGAALMGVGGFWFAYYFWQLQARPLLPVHVPALEEGVNHA